MRDLVGAWVVCLAIAAGCFVLAGVVSLSDKVGNDPNL
jgi:hypothetical protein